jgi:tetratricopeptide (TPR) repeat protein
MNWLFNICLFVWLASRPGILLSSNVSQDGFTEEGHQSQEQDGSLARTGCPATRAEAENSPARALSSIKSLNAQAIAHQDKGQYVQAEPLFRQALALCEEYPEPDQPLILVTTLNNLARLYYDRGRYTDMEPLLQRALTIGENALGSEKVEVAVTLDNLGYLYMAQGHYEKAQPLLLRGLRIRERKLGLDHPDVATSLSNWGNLLFWQRKYAEAEKLQRRALLIRQKTLGTAHHDLAISMNRLRQVCPLRGRLTQAENGIVSHRCSGKRPWEKNTRNSHYAHQPGWLVPPSAPI